MSQKYVVFESMTYGIFPVILSEITNHGDIAKCFRDEFNCRPTSAGYCNAQGQVWGNSSSLKLKSQEDDSVFIEKTLKDPKYLTLAVPGGITEVLIFPSMLDHKKVLDAIHTHYPGLEVQGAGFISLANGVNPRGKSVSLDKGPAPDDKFYLERMLGEVSFGGPGD